MIWFCPCMRVKTQYNIQYVYTTDAQCAVCNIWWSGFWFQLPTHSGLKTTQLSHHLQAKTHTAVSHLPKDWAYSQLVPTTLYVEPPVSLTTLNNSATLCTRPWGLLMEAGPQTPPYQWCGQWWAAYSPHSPWSATQTKQQPLPNICHNIHYSSLCNNTTHSHHCHLHQVTAHSSLINKQNTISLVQHSNNIICHILLLTMTSSSIASPPSPCLCVLILMWGVSHEATFCCRRNLR